MPVCYLGAAFDDRMYILDRRCQLNPNIRKENMATDLSQLASELLKKYPNVQLNGTAAPPPNNPPTPPKSFAVPSNLSKAFVTPKVSRKIPSH